MQIIALNRRRLKIFSCLLASLNFLVSSVCIRSFSGLRCVVQSLHVILDDLLVYVLLDEQYPLPAQISVSVKVSEYLFLYHRIAS